VAMDITKPSDRLMNCEELLKEYETDKNEINAKKLIALLDEELRSRWKQAMNEMSTTRVGKVGLY